MEVVAFKLEDGESFQRLADPSIRSMSSLGAPTWHDFTATEEEWAQICAVHLELGPFSTDLMSRHRQIAFGLVTHNSASFRVPLVDNAGTDEIDFLAGVCVGDRLVTFHNAHSASLDRFVQQVFDAPGPGRVDSIADLVAALFTHLSFDLIDIGHRLRQQVDDLTARSFEGHVQVHTPELNAAESIFHEVDSAVDDYRHVLTILADAHTEVLDLSDTIPPLAIALGNVSALADDVRVYDGRLQRLQDRHAARLQEGVTHRINVLTVISAIFLPLSLLAGIFGMNFEHMPGLDLRWGFAMLMALMLAIALGLAWYVRYRKWF